VAREQFGELTKRAFKQFVSERVSDRLRSALEKADVPAGGAGPLETDEDDGIETTIEEIEGYHIVKAVVREVVDPKRVVHRDTKSYMGILLDDNNRKPICRLHFNRAQKYLGLFDAEKRETREAIDSLNDIYRFADKLKETAGRY